MYRYWNFYSFYLYKTHYNYKQVREHQDQTYHNQTKQEDLNWQKTNFTINYLDSIILRFKGDPNIITVIVEDSIAYSPETKLSYPTNNLISHCYVQYYWGKSVLIWFYYESC